MLVLLVFVGLIGEEIELAVGLLIKLNGGKIGGGGGREN